ncbi:hypothetical protein LSAT2_012060 [Lamellibrachia satsuma]|nr:hypothetical protein LSAT2_012060 [Lamellibrachia satsuma]
MGCTSSREKDPSGETYERRRCGGDSDDFLTEHQKTLVRDTWRLLSDDLVSRGSMIFLYIFKKRPSAKELFPFRDVEGDALLRNAMFKGHGKRFMHAVETTVMNLDALDVILVPTLYQLGKRHAYITDIFIDYQAVFKDAIIDTFEQELGPACTADVRQAWTLLFDFIGSKLLEGYDVGMRDRRVAESADAKEDTTADVAATVGRERADSDDIKGVCPVNLNGDVSMTALATDTAEIVRTTGQPSFMQPSCKLPDHACTDPATASSESVGVSVVERTGDVVTTTTTTTTAAAATTTTTSNSTAPLVTLDEILTTPTSPCVVADPSDVQLVTSCAPEVADGVRATSTADKSADDQTALTCNTTESTNDAVSATEIQTANDIPTTHSTNDQTVTPHVVQTQATPTSANTCGSPVNASSPTTANVVAKSPQTPTERRALIDLSNSVVTTHCIVTSLSGGPGECVTTSNDIAVTNIDSNGGLPCSMYSGCNGATATSEGGDVGQLLQTNTV